jgi:hypothetical protein
MTGPEIDGDRAPGSARSIPSAVAQISSSAPGAGVDVTGRRHGSLKGPAVAGLIGSVCVLFGTAEGGSPFAVKTAGAWFFGVGASAGSGANDRFLGIMLVYVGIALMLGSWYEVVRFVRSQPGTAIKPLAAILVAWEVPLLLSAPLFSGDVYSYAAQGQMVTLGINPYAHGPNALRSGPFLNLVDPLWRHSPAPYGPAWERLSGWIVQLSGHDVLAAVVGFRIAALIGVTLIAWAVPALARGVGRDASGAFALAVLNPLVLLGLLGGAHNDALMLGLLVAGCALARTQHVLMGLALCALAAEVKIPALIGVIFIGWWWSGPEAAARQRLGRIALALGLATGFMVTIGVFAGLGWRWIDGLTNSGAVVSWLDPATGVGLLLAHAVNSLGYAGHQPAFVDGARIAALGLAAVISIRLLVRSDRQAEVQALGWSLVVFVVLGPVVWPWYETWGFVFLAIVAEGWILVVVVIFSAVACVADVPNPRFLVAANPILVSLCWACLVTGIGLFAWTRTGSNVTWGPSPRTGRRVKRPSPGTQAKDRTHPQVGSVSQQ